MTIKVGINGLGRIGRIALREWWGSDAFSIVHVNEIGGDAKSVAHLTKFDSVHGTWDKDIVANSENNSLVIGGELVGFSQSEGIENPAWKDAKVDLVIECTVKSK